jgi:hypothetical protein
MREASALRKTRNQFNTSSQCRQPGAYLCISPRPGAPLSPLLWCGETLNPHARVAWTAGALARGGRLVRAPQRAPDIEARSEGRHGPKEWLSKIQGVSTHGQPLWKITTFAVAMPHVPPAIRPTLPRSARHKKGCLWCPCVEEKEGNHGKGRRCCAPAFAHRAPDHTAAASLFAPPPETVPAPAPVTPPAVEPTPVAEEATQHAPDATMPAPELWRQVQDPAPVVGQPERPEKPENVLHGPVGQCASLASRARRDRGGSGSAPVGGPRVVTWLGSWHASSPHVHGAEATTAGHTRRRPLAGVPASRPCAAGAALDAPRPGVWRWQAAVAGGQDEGLRSWRRPPPSASVQ